ncbi:DUF485 domain-containing protein [Pseudomonas sp. 21LCFQ02]|uniref:DUF485 domain-containing protein n=1 Tax=unclassified Pseudomonas TaxID=196821 RepID=UPI0004F7EFCF|nr:MULTISPECIES: DUF485 domain-containing protein [unclassified Pseudomonas]MCO8165144.1 DUF485 domain-containing protein [Pseudomonas sp. 21LCFQ010]MCO8167411.1 DUF485 domain-containing protein [Pseudomonas sp. 21LCFQ02]MCQ9424996.1 DUF485 domain-containing protein [Pseudomonas sp. LJDD11]BAP44252.1 membrane protein PaaW [Pseudomonas sp. StFLB209]
MTPQDIEQLQRHPDFIELVKRKQRLTWSLTLIMLGIYYGFVVLMAFYPQTLGRSLSGGVTSLGIVLAVAVILLSFVLTALYVRQSNRVLDPLTEKLLQQVQP